MSMRFRTWRRMRPGRRSGRSRRFERRLMAAMRHLASVQAAEAVRRWNEAA